MKDLNYDIRSSGRESNLVPPENKPFVWDALLFIKDFINFHVKVHIFGFHSCNSWSELNLHIGKSR